MENWIALSGISTKRERSFTVPVDDDHAHARCETERSALALTSSSRVDRPVTSAEA